MTALVAGELDRGAVNLIVSFDRPDGPLTPRNSPLLGYIIEATADGERYRMSNKPTYRFIAREAPCPPGLGDMSSAVCLGATIIDRMGPTDLTLYIEDVDRTGVCLLAWTLSVELTVVFRADPAQGQTRVDLDVRGFLEAARAYEAILPSSARNVVNADTLGDFLDQQNIERSVDTAGDGDANAWFIRLFGRARAVQVSGDPGDFWGYRPQNLCEL